MWTLSGFADEIDPDLEDPVRDAERPRHHPRRVPQRLGHQRAGPDRRADRRGRGAPGGARPVGLVHRLADRQDQYRGRLRRPPRPGRPGPGRRAAPRRPVHPDLLLLPAPGPGRRSGTATRCSAGWPPSPRRPSPPASCCCTRTRRTSTATSRSACSTSSSRSARPPCGWPGTPPTTCRSGVTPFTDGYATLRPYTVYVQIKDALLATGDVVPAGEGDGQVRETVRALAADGFDGFFSMEPHLGHLQRVRRALRAGELHPRHPRVHRHPRQRRDRVP